MGGSETPVARRRVLLCYDGSTEAQHALERVGELAATFPSRVTVISVAEPIYRDPPWTGYADPSEERAHRRLLDDAIAYLRSRGVEATAVEPIGQPATEIVEEARDDGVDLVVVGGRHRALIERLLFASVSTHVVADAPCDVLIVH